MLAASNEKHRPRVVIVGAGFGGLSLAKGLAGAPFDVTVIDRHNYHLFQPLLYQVATAALSPADIAAPIRAILRGRPNVNVVLADVSGVDVGARQVIAEGSRIAWDILVLATGAEHAYFGHDDWAPVAPGLKTIDDATDLRRRILLAFERAETASDATERTQLLTFVVVGGGPTGVEMAGAIAELAKWALAADFRNIDPRSARIVLVEAGPRLLSALHPSLSEKARLSLEKLGVEVRLDAIVTSCSSQDVSIGDERIQTRTIMWAAGVKASPAAEWLGVPADRAGRVKVEPDLSVAGHPDVYVLGDTALVHGADGKPLPGVAPVAKQQGEYLARCLLARSRGEALHAFRYRDFGSLATIGRKQAVADFGKVRLSGFIAWVLWSVAHIYFLIGFRRRTIVALHWAWSYITFQRGTRLITGLTGSRMRDDAGNDRGPGDTRMRGAA